MSEKTSEERLKEYIEDVTRIIYLIEALEKAKKKFKKKWINYE